MRILTLVFVAVLLSACATRPQISQFKPVSLTNPIKHVEQAQSHIKQSQAAAAALAKECAQKTAKWQSAYDLLNKELTDAYTSAQIAKEQLGDKQNEINRQTSAANTVVAERNEAVAKVSVEHARGNKWMKRTFGAAFLLLLAGLWIFKRPLLRLAGIAAFSLMLAAPALGNIGDSPGQFESHFKNTEFTKGNGAGMVDYVIVARSREFFCFGGFKNGKSVIETWMANPASAGIPRDALARVLSPYGQPGTFKFVAQDENTLTVATFDEKVFIVFGTIQGIEQVTFMDADFVSGFHPELRVYYVPPVLPDGDTEEESPQHIPRA